MTLDGKVALVTGGGRGIGKGIAGSLAREGAKILVADIDGKNAEAAAAELSEAGHEASAIQTNVTKADEVEAMVEAAYQRFGGLDVAVNNAGVVGAVPLAEMSEAEWDRIHSVNVKGVFLCCRAQAPRMAKKGGGAIINLASIAGKVGVPMLSHYCASKFAVIGFTNSIAKEFAQSGVRVNAICPGIVATAMWHGETGLSTLLKGEDETPDDVWESRVSTMLPQGVEQTPEDMGALAVFLATQPHITGQSINVDGGFATY